MHSFNKTCIETPELLKSVSRTGSISRSKPHLPPGTSSLSKSNFNSALDNSSDYHILVFGYKQQEKDKVIEKFKKFGVIEKVVEQGDFILAVRYRDPKDAAQACDLNAQVILDDTMIGVKPINSAGSMAKSSFKYLTECDSFCYSRERKLKKKFGTWQRCLYYLLNLEIRGR